jgi:OmpA-OmpF porin, OOP family
MKSRYLLGAGAAVAMALSGAGANAQFAFLGGPYPVAFYVGPEGGWTSLQDQTDTISNPPFAACAGLPTVANAPCNAVTGAGFGPIVHGLSATTRYNSGFNAGARLGLQYGPIRVEEEYSYHHNGLSNFDGLSTSSIPSVSGDRNAHAIMTNFIYDFTLGWPVSPHVGFGVGAVDIVDDVSLGSVKIPGPLTIATPGCPDGGCVFPAGTTFGGTWLKDSEWQFGYQAIAGFRYDINPLLAFDLDYRYLATTQGTFTNKGVFPLPNTPGGFAPHTVTYKSGYNTNNIVASLTMKFGAPPPPPPPPAPPVPPPPIHQVYLVFFDWDKYNITPEGMRIIELAADHYKAGGRVQITVTGYTDTSGSPGYNQRLSERRANAVAAALERLGVPRSDMIVAGRGENDLRVPTPPGVREPQNRRVEIVFP